MKRTIKFRAYDKTRKEYLSAGHIFLQINAGRNPADCVQYLDLLNNPNAYADRFVIEQFTGLYDKAKKPIYEGDRVRILQAEGAFDIVVKWSNEAMAFMACYADGNQSPFSWFTNLRIYQLTVIGSIHDTPELLNEKEK